MPHGKLTVVVEGAAGIKTQPGAYGRGSSYCTLACGSQVSTSPTVEGSGSHSLFKTAFEFDIDRTTNELNVCVYNKGSTSRDDDLVGNCTLNFKKIFFHGHTVPPTAYPMQQPSGNPGGTINISFKFKMRPAPNGLNTHAPLRCSERPQVVHKIIGRQSVSLDWGYDCREEDASRTQSAPNPVSHEDCLKMPGTASHKYQETPPCEHHEEYPNLPGSASVNYRETKPSFIRYGKPAKLRPSNPQTPNPARPSPMMENNQPIPGKPQYNQPIPGKPQYNQPIPGKPQYNQPIPGISHYNQQMVEMANQLGNEMANQLGNEMANQLGNEMANQFGNEMANQFGSEMANQLGNEMANQLGSEMANQFGGGAVQALLDGFCNF